MPETNSYWEQNGAQSCGDSSSFLWLGCLSATSSSASSLIQKNLCKSAQSCCSQKQFRWNFSLFVINQRRLYSGLNELVICQRRLHSDLSQFVIGQRQLHFRLCFRQRSAGRFRSADWKIKVRKVNLYFYRHQIRNALCYVVILAVIWLILMKGKILLLWDDFSWWLFSQAEIDHRNEKRTRCIFPVISLNTSSYHHLGPFWYLCIIVTSSLFLFRLSSHQHRIIVVFSEPLYTIVTSSWSFIWSLCNDQNALLVR